MGNNNVVIREDSRDFSFIDINIVLTFNIVPHTKILANNKVVIFNSFFFHSKT
ncbi:hypothetical protein GCM10007384_11430 [Aquimarina muelleri]|uniref:Uncharacterized protein n=1 Tax=Aquimarina muelleri TaxID=279356 RepID=A0A918JUP9_9FLAO|nr:hypothetical protein GCM10007384_11430 [Aquimarina muelleri]